ncbi:hypothetical protein E5288_WYG004296 [Bos mutus]|uniref:Uncharacterized protein n=1 Tax=Bos mutus TaxID=72004 RepID=A0A6B0R4F0_9CETA|nr:hypothetical protein [Bos mutus]
MHGCQQPTAQDTGTLFFCKRPDEADLWLQSRGWCPVCWLGACRMHKSVTDASLRSPNDPRAPVTCQASSSARPVDLDSCNMEFIVSTSRRREHGGQGCEVTRRKVRKQLEGGSAPYGALLVLGAQRGHDLSDLLGKSMFMVPFRTDYDDKKTMKHLSPKVTSWIH